MAKRKYYRIGKKRFLKTEVRRDLKRIIEGLYIGLIIGFVLMIKIDGQVVEAEASKQAEAATQVSLEEEGEKAQNEPPQVSRTDDETINQIIDIAEEHDFPWINYLVKLTTCENRDHDPAKRQCELNYPAGSCDRGLFQINDHWHAEVSDACAHDIRCSTEWTMQRIEDGYQKEWMCDALIRSGEFKN